MLVTRCVLVATLGLPFAGLQEPGEHAVEEVVVRVYPHPASPVRQPQPGSLTLVGQDGTLTELELESDGWNVWHSGPVPPGDYSVRLEDPLFAPAVVEDVVPGKTYILRPVGGAMLQVRFLDPVGLPWEKSVVVRTLRDEEPSASGNGPEGWRRVGRAGGRNEGGLELFPIPQLLRFEAYRCGVAELRLEDLAKGETRSVEIQLQAFQEVRGRLLGADGAAVGGAVVDAVSTDHGSEKTTLSVATDAQGWFQFAVSPLLSTRVSISPAESVEFGFESVDAMLSTPGWPDLRVPPRGTLSGRLLLGQFAPQVPVRVHLHAFQGPEGREPFRFDSSNGFERDDLLGLGPGYSIEGLTPGKYSLWIERPGLQHGPRWLKSQIAERFELLAGEDLVLDLDARPWKLELLRLNVNVEGGAGRARQLAIEPHTRGTRRTHFQPDLKSDGTGVFANLRPGPATPFALVEVGAAPGSEIAGGGARMWLALERIKLPRAGEHRIALDLALHPGRIGLRDPGGGRLGQALVRLEQPGSWAHETATGLRADDEGELQLWLPVGSYTLCSPQVGLKDLPQKLQFDWPPAGGILELKLRP